MQLDSSSSNAAVTFRPTEVGPWVDKPVRGKMVGLCKKQEILSSGVLSPPVSLGGTGDEIIQTNEWFPIFFSIVVLLASD